ncbi:MAG TPA: hypothetical protein VN883_16535 [Myxococcales bacterium]|jgi:hypothetical protein|nr:hypothetical protein [Myxococcales bacterium]
MARRNRDRRGTSQQPEDWESERTLAAAEQDQAELAATQPAATDDAPGGAAVVTCACGGHEFLLQAYLHVVDGQPQGEMVEVEGLTCPQCGREYEAIPVAGGRVLRGDFIGYADLASDD